MASHKRQKKLVPLTLEQHQQVLYEILYMVDDFCKAHDIPYFLVGGTLLGAVRHQGIIPWDDDADIAMTRENYERFITLFHAEPVDGYELLDYEHTKGFRMPFAKMAKRDSWTSFWETHKINIDIFPYDGCGDTLEAAQERFVNSRAEIQRFNVMHVVFLSLWKSHCTWKEIVYYFAVNCVKDLFKYYPIFLTARIRKRFLRKVFTKYATLRVSDTKYSANITWGIYGNGEVQLSSSFLNLDTMRFGSRELPVPSGWHDYLTGIYGDYMTLPPENERRRHLKDASCLVVTDVHPND